MVDLLAKGFVFFDGLKFITTAGQNSTATTSIKISAYSAVIGDLVRCDPSGGGFTITLPSATGNVDKVVIVKNVTSSLNPITIATVNSQTIDGLTTQTMNIPEQSLTIYSNGNGWLLI